MPEDSPSIYTIMAERVANAILGKINALIGGHNTNTQAHQDIRENIPGASSTTPSADTTAGGVGASTTWARSDHTHPQSSLYAESTHEHSIEDTDLFDVLDCINTNFTDFTTQYLFDYLTDIDDYYAQSLPNDTMGCGSTDSMSVTENDELLISDYQTRVFHNNIFTSSNHYVLELDLKKPDGIYKGADFEVIIGEPSKFIKFDSGYYGEFIHYLLEENGTQQEVSYQTTSDRFTDYFTLRITRNGNAWKGEWIVNDTVLRTLEATTPLDISNKLGFCSYSWHNYNSDELYIKNIKITDLESNVNSLNTSIPNIECSDYNPSIDDNITVTITVTDVYGNVMSNESVTVTASEGNFTQLNGSDISIASSVTGTTNSNGQFTLTYSCSEWGLITFSVNTKQLQIFITGFKFIQSNITYNLYVDESQRLAQIRVNRSNVTIGTGDGFNYSDFKIPSQYRPKSNSFVSVDRTIPSILNYVWTDGTIGIYNNTGNQWTNYTLAFQHEWHY